MSASYEITCFSVAASPISHMSGTEGNEAILAREAVATPSGVQYVPALSGNQIRHKLVREPGMLWLIDQYGLAGRLSLKQYNFLLHGGALTDSTKTEDLARVADWQRLFPLGRLLGGCLPDQILAGSLLAGRGVFVCRENQGRVESMIDHKFDKPLRAAASLVDGWQYTRSGSAARRNHLLKRREPKPAEVGLFGAIDAPADDLDVEPGDEKTGNLMIFAGQSIISGAAFLHQFTIPHGSILELGALLWSLRLWKEAGGTVGGMAARGHGRLTTAITSGVSETEMVEAIDAYKTHATAVKDEAVDWLDRAFAKTAEKPARASKKRAS